MLPLGGIWRHTKSCQFSNISKHYSPRMIVHKENIDYERHCCHAIGDYVTAPHQPEQLNTNAARELDCLYLRPVSGEQGGHKLLHPSSNKQRNYSPKSDSISCYSTNHCPSPCTGRNRCDAKGSCHMPGIRVNNTQ